MAYLGSTQLSSIANPPVLMFGTGGIDQRIPGTGTTGSTIYVNNAWRNQGSTITYQEGRAFGGQMWAYWTTDNTTAVTSTAGYFTDAGPLGMRPGDVVMIVGCGSTVGSSIVLRFAAVTGITTGGTAYMSSASLATAT
tara:strand:- start:83 stop:496 length:414 start_codon:yes stop_codon:yes gene_type:complete